jgi:hypothetical protein
VDERAMMEADGVLPGSKEKCRNGCCRSSCSASGGALLSPQKLDFVASFFIVKLDGKQ